MLSKIINIRNLIWFCAVGLATFSGYYSIIGIAKLFSGGSWSIIGMATMLEVSKLVVVTFLHKHFKTLRLLFKGYLLSAAVVLMAITSIGVYGYLTNSYQETAKVVYKAQNEITLLDQKKQLFLDQKKQLDKMIVEKTNRLKSLDNIRISQQNTYAQQSIQKKSTNGLSRSITSIDKTSELLNTELSQLTQKSFDLSDSIAKIDVIKLNVSDETFSSELGPLLYLSRITGFPMDIVVNWFILILVLVFDPLAVSLVVAGNHIKDNEKKADVLNELTELGQLIGAKSNFDPIQEDVVNIPEYTEPTPAKVESVHSGLVRKAKATRRKNKTNRLKNIEKNSILSTEPFSNEQHTFYEELPETRQGIPETETRYKRGVSV